MHLRGESPAPAQPRAIVGIGASAGGLQALSGFFDHLPADTGAAFVIIMHLDPRRETELPELLAAHTELPVELARDQTPLQRDRVYVCPPGALVALQDGRLRVEASEVRASHPIDRVLSSLASDRGRTAIGVILSGSGSDGAQGIKLIKEAGGLTIAQAPSSAQHSDMPRAAALTGLVDFVLGAEEMPERVTDYLQHLRVQADARRAPKEAEEAERHLEEISTLLARTIRHDFSRYKKSTFLRRVQRRMLVRQVGSPAEYVELLRRDPEESEHLFKELLISVTSFFRDPEAFRRLGAELCRLVEGGSARERIRVWVPGCATGEETYSIAILLAEAMQKSEKQVPAHIFATDVDVEALQVARRGRYPAGTADQVTAQRLSRFFEPRGDDYQVSRELREMCIFSQHDLITDPPFSNIDLISCRNLLIYFEPDLQARALELFHYALRPRSLLFLGPAETASARADLFELVDKKHRIFRAEETSPRVGPVFPLSAAEGSRARQPALAPRTRRDQDTAGWFSRWLIDHFGPPAALVDRNNRVVYMSGRLGPYFEHGTGPIENDLLSLARAPLRLHLRSALRKAHKSGRETVASGLTVRVDGEARTLDLTVTPLGKRPDERELWAVVFQERQAAEAPEARAPSPSADRTESVAQLEAELEVTRSQLQATVEELESSNDELKSSNEVLLSMNEELQSSNEELQTSQEELQSVNEELETVNTELETKVEELDRAHADLENLFESTRIPTVFVDKHLHIQQFTPAAAEVLRLQAAKDTGRHIGDVTARFRDIDLTAEIRAVLDSLSPREMRVQRDDGGPPRTYLLRILPYRTLNDVIDGAVLTFPDVTELDRAVARFQLRERQQAAVARLGRRALGGAALRDLFTAAAQEIRETLAAELVEVLEAHGPSGDLLLVAGSGWQDGLVGAARIADDRLSQAGFTLRADGAVLVEDWSRENRIQRPEHLAAHGAQSGATCAFLGPDGPRGVLGAHAREPDKFTRDDAHFLQAIANILSTAVQRQAIARRLSIEHGVAQALAETTSLEQATPRVLEALSDSTGVKACEFWLPVLEADGTRRLHCERVVSPGTPERERELRETFSRRTFRPGEGLVGASWHKREPIWLTELAEAKEFARRDEARKLGFRSGFAVPILSRGERIGVLTCFSTETLIPDSHLMRSLARIGLVIGDLVIWERSQRALRESERRFRELAEAIPHMVWVASADGKPEQYNQRALEFLGPSLSARGGAPLLESVHPEDRSEVEAAWRRAREAGEEYAVDARLRRAADDAYVWHAIHAVPRRDQQGNAAGWFGTCTDIAVRKRAEVDLARLAAIVRSSDDGILAKDLRGTILSWNAGCERLYGYTAEEAIGRSIDFIVPPDRQRELEDIMTRLRRGERIDHIETVRLRKDGGRVEVSVTVSPLKDGDGNIVGASAVARDIGEKKRTEEALREADRQKDQFLAMLGHELRNPLSTIRTATQLLEFAEVDAEVFQRTRQVLERQTSQMTKLIDGLLDVSRIARGKIHIQERALDLAALARALLEDRRHDLEGSGLELGADVPADPLWVEGDEVRLAQVFSNLITNAANFTDAPGRVTVTLRSAGDEAEVSVQDTGVGIEPELLKHIFEPFRQASQSLDRSTGGLGLGLSLVKGLVELHGGSVTASSAGRGKGAEFTVRLPLSDRPSEEAPSEPAEIGSARLLLVEDSEDAALLLKELLESAGHEVAVAGDGPQALARAREFSPDLVLCDIGLPGDMSGYDIARALRERPGPAPYLVAVTGYGTAEDRQRAEEAGFDAHLTKPVSLETIQEVLARATDRSGGNE